MFNVELHTRTLIAAKGSQVAGKGKPGGGGGGTGNLKSGAGGRGEDGKVIVGWGPQVTTVKKSGQADPTNALPVSFTVSFSEEVQDFDPVNQAADVDFTGSTATGLTVTNIVRENLTDYTVNVNCSGTDGRGRQRSHWIDG